MSKIKSCADSDGDRPPLRTKPPRIPPAFTGIQYNFCKNPACANYGIEPKLKSKQTDHDFYTLSGGGKSLTLLKCKSCGERPPLKSNAGIVEELARITSYLEPIPTPSCPNPLCENRGVSLGTKRAYQSFGMNRGGSKRYRCRKCLATFSIPTPARYQHDTHHNQAIFKMLVNKVPFARIVSMLDISWEVFYHRLDFVHRQCLAFAADRERNLNVLPIRRLYLATDRQEYTVNWTERKDKRNIVLSAVASADNSSGYVFGVHSNFDPSSNRDVVEADARSVGDCLLSSPFRKYARFWLECDYLISVNRTQGKRYRIGTTLDSAISAAYATAGERLDVEVFDEKTTTQKLPDYGLQVHAEYTLVAHFYFLKKMLGNVEGWRFFLDQESGIRSACLSAFQPEIAARTAEAFYVRISKDLTVDRKRQLTALSKGVFEGIKLQNPSLSDGGVRLLMLKGEIAKIRQFGQWEDRWARHPLPTMSEPEKAACWLTEHSQFDEDHVAWLYNKASLHAVDAFFQKVRRRISLLERPIHSSANAGRVWNGYAAYNPATVQKLLDIFRVVHNFIDKRQTKQGGIKSVTTPATRLGLAQAPLTYSDVIYFSAL